MTTVGFLGCGRMGAAMAGSIARAGFDLVLYNRTPNRAYKVAREVGGRAVETPAEAAAKADVLISMVSDGAAVKALYRDRGGALEALTARTVAIDMSTVLPDTIRGLEADVRATSAAILDAPVSGNVSVAEAGRLTIMAGGTVEDLERARPVLEAMSARILHMGPLGAGATMKLSVNAVIFALNEAVSEALVLAERAGIPRELAHEVLATSAVGAPFVQYNKAAFVDPDTAPTVFSMDLAAKDLALIRDLAAEFGVSMPQMAVNRSTLIEAGASLGGSTDFTRMATYLRSQSDRAAAMERGP